MKFRYRYRTSDNALHSGTISASSREDAFATLKGQGIRPVTVNDAPGIWNKLWGRGKRWMAIVILSAILAVVLGRMASKSPALRSNVLPLPRRFIPELATPSNYPPLGVFEHLHEQFLALYAMPGMNVAATAMPTTEILSDFEKNLGSPIIASDNDLPPIAELKGIVAGMKEDAKKYIGINDGIKRFCEELHGRQEMERSYREQFVRRVHRQELTREEANKVFAAMGLEPLK